jgi:NAD(P)-dependent dehydrogenase (short-subunit alcohol dehydrogenase family)
VRERHELRDAVEAGLADLGRIDIVVANAGILPMAMGKPDPMQFVHASDVDLVGVVNTVAVAIPHLPDGASIIVTGSTAGMIRGTTDNPNMGPGGAGYGWSKRIVMEYVEEMSLHLAPRMIRVNAIHPTNCNTHLLQNDGMYSMFRPDLTAAVNRRPARTPNRCSPSSRRCRSRTSNRRTWPTSESFSPATRAATSPVSRSAWTPAHFSSGPTGQGDKDLKRRDHGSSH